ncbi:hypothetical protein [Flavobacterium sp. KACC 22761]|uniref:hypothetical protein n=1 Tax=Flavobacterium sp. KACC 22761 TaxID=3092665 RepID=UPI002A74F9F2|nr:hypothetical protein [Flavobacterium sp. KACC 22761]WPO78517.1 hypothetical protein SCB73_19840 [Flavobacterium sp. KACC 22761]
MNTIRKVIELLSKKYSRNIAVNQDGAKYTYLLDTNNGTLFSASYNSLFLFKDANNNFWSTVPRSFSHNKKKYHPKLGEEYVQKDGVRYSFTSKEAILAMANSYFGRFTNPYNGIKVADKGRFFSNNANQKSTKYDLILEKFKGQNKIYPQFSVN